MNYLFIKIFVFLIKIYKTMLSPFLPARCRYAPTCSEYSLIAIKKYGIIKGVWLSIKRICSCHPYGGDGYDPVP